MTYTEDATNYPFTYAYNNQGTVDMLTYPVSTSGYQFVLKNVYDAYGYLNEVKDNAAGTVFWALNSANDSNLPTLETLGNGAQVATSYTPWTNEMITRSQGAGGSTNNLQSLAYNWDLAGNLHQRIDSGQGITEQFAYDSMNRLLNSTRNSTSNLTVTYDASGNINSKSDVSASPYVYDTTHKHAVATAGSWSMTYDADGNMITRAGGSLTWYSYNLPNTISYGSNSTQFFYNSSHQRWKQVANYAGTTETTHYIGGLLEVMTRGSGPTEYRHQIPAGSGTAVYTRRTDGTTGTYYATSDHLGSADLVMDSAANVLARESFTPFGARRGSNWTGTPTVADYTAFGNTTRKGFTGHEMLDSVSLVHMNGRVYDPYLGRFLSADSVIQSLGASQSINPYAYAWNDPLRYIDPSGHDLLGDIIGAIFGAILAYFTFGIANAFLASEFVIGSSVYAGAIAGFVGGFIGAAIATGSLSAALSAGLIGGVTGGLFAGGGLYADDPHADWGIGEKVLAHAFVGCVSGELSSGNCGKGALSAAASEYIGEQVGHVADPNSLSNWGVAGETAKFALIGGVVAQVAAGNFVEGFSVGAAGYLLNDLSQKKSDGGYRVYLVAESGSPGHTFLGFIDPDGDMQAWGFYPQQDNAAALVEGEPGAVRDNLSEFRQALEGDSGYSVHQYNVTETQFFRTLESAMFYDESNNYGLFTNNCVSAAFDSLNRGGVTRSVIPVLQRLMPPATVVSPNDVGFGIRHGIF